MEQKILTSRSAHGLNKKIAEAIEEGFVPKGSHSVVTVISQNQYSGNQMMRTLHENEYSQTVVKESIEWGRLSESWQVGRAQGVFDAINEGDTMLYEFVNFDDIGGEAFDFEEGATNDDIEIAMNKSLLNNGYQWADYISGNINEEVLMKKDEFTKKE